MIVADDGGSWLLVTQNDHAVLAADLLTCWPALATAPRRDLLLRATRLHDNGWRETDSAPRIDAHGRPQDFLAVPPAARHELWERGMDRYRDSDPACALLIVAHALWLHRDDGGDPELAGLVRDAESRRAELAERVEQAGELVDELYPWLRVADDLSLRACWGREEPFEIELPTPSRQILRGRLRRSADSNSWKITLAPFPFAGATTFRVPCRRLPRQRFARDTDLAIALAAERWDELRLRVEPDLSSSEDGSLK
jgi:hypothetical protein